jgi:NAD(P)-dependent dehydrogenase (short-subunit alcohol dehydrogenase family)
MILHAAQAQPGKRAYMLAKGVLAVRCLVARSTQGGKMANYELDGRTAIVTGAGAGIGEACAHVLSSSGAAVLVVDLDEERAESVASSISKDGGTALPHVADVSKLDDVEAMVARAEEDIGPLRIAVNNAGIGGTSQPTGQYDVDAWRRVMSVNLDGVFYCMRAEIGPMSRAGGGSIINMSSVLGSVGIENSPAYVASKHGVVGLTKAAALEHAAEGVRVNAVGPGFISTPLLEENLPAEAQAQIATLHALGRLGTSEEVANLVAFLASDDASFITGSYHLVDAGYTAR